MVFSSSNWLTILLNLNVLSSVNKGTTHISDWISGNGFEGVENDWLNIPRDGAKLDGIAGVCEQTATIINLPYSRQYYSNGAPSGCIKYNDGRVISVDTCSGHVNCNTQNCNGCKVLFPIFGGMDSCKQTAARLGLPFSTQFKSNGAPAGCIKYNDGRVIFVETCNNHVNCGTQNCNGCSVLDPRLGMVETCNELATTLSLPFSTQITSNGAPAGCMKYDDGRVIYVEECNNHVNCGTNNCNGCEVLFPASVFTEIAVRYWQGYGIVNLNVHSDIDYWSGANFNGERYSTLVNARIIGIDIRETERGIMNMRVITDDNDDSYGKWVTNDEDGVIKSLRIPHSNFMVTGIQAKYNNGLGIVDLRLKYEDTVTCENANCDANAKCTDTIEGFTCTCNAGFEGDGVSCNDIDECASEANICAQYGLGCINLEGGFQCKYA